MIFYENEPSIDSVDAENWAAVRERELLEFDNYNDEDYDD